jgi:hypothetical protein
VRYFTRGWASGELSDQESNSARDAYWAHVAEITPRLPPEMVRMIRDVRLHDAIIEQVVWNPDGKKLELALVATSAQDECIGVKLSYGGAMLGAKRVDALRRAALSRETELPYDEVDIDDEGVLSHRLLFHPCEEVSIDFRDFATVVSPRAHRWVRLLPAFVQVEGD